MVILPSFVQAWPGIYPAALKRDNLPEADFKPGLGAERVRRRLEQAGGDQTGDGQAGVRVVDLTRPIAAHASPASLYLPTDLHLSTQGHQVVANELRPVLAAILAPSLSEAPTAEGQK